MSPKDQVNEERGGGTVVPGQVRKQNVENIVVNGDMVHKTIVCITIEVLQNLRERTTIGSL